MIFTWIIVLSLEFCIGLLYFILSGPLNDLLNSMVAAGAPEAKISFISMCYHGAFIVVGSGLIIYALLRSLTKENDTYSY